MEDRIRLSKPSFGEREFQSLRETLEDGWVGMGPQTVKFEEHFAKYIGVKHAIALNSCTAALHLAMLAAEVDGQDVLTTSMTFISTNHAILHSGGRPVFCDIEADTFNINPDEIKKKITPTTRAIVVMHYGGHSCDMNPIMELAEEHGLWVIEDVAQGCGGLYQGRKLGSLGYIGCFSFQGTKNMTTGDGGMLVTDNDAVAARIRKLRWVGISKPTWERFRPGRPNRSWMYEVEEVGFKYEMNDIAASLGLVQLERIGDSNARRRCLLNRYREVFSEVDGIEVMVQKDYAESACYNAVIKTDSRDELYDYLDQQGIDSNVHYFPNHKLPIYRPYTTRLPVTEHEWKRILSIPLYPDLTDVDQQRVIDCVKYFLAENQTKKTIAGV